MPDDYVIETMEHKKQVAFYLQKIANELFTRAIVHDNSKFSPNERPLYEMMTPLLKTLEYGTEEYKASLKELGPALAHHYANNRHHPEFHPDGIMNMNLVDLIEMLCDWMAAVKRTKNGNIAESLVKNKERFRIGTSLFLALANTVDDILEDAHAH